jgi:hypothetical protein
MRWRRGVVAIGSPRDGLEWPGEERMQREADPMEPAYTPGRRTIRQGRIEFNNGLQLTIHSANQSERGTVWRRAPCPSVGGRRCWAQLNRWSVGQPDGYIA